MYGTTDLDALLCNVVPHDRSTLLSLIREESTLELAVETRRSHSLIHPHTLPLKSFTHPAGSLLSAGFVTTVRKLLFDQKPTACPFWIWCRFSTVPIFRCRRQLDKMNRRRVRSRGIERASTWRDPTDPRLLLRMRRLIFVARPRLMWVEPRR